MYATPTRLALFLFNCMGVFLFPLFTHTGILLIVARCALAGAPQNYIRPIPWRCQAPDRHAHTWRWHRP